MKEWDRLWMIWGSPMKGLGLGLGLVEDDEVGPKTSAKSKSCSADDGGIVRLLSLLAKIECRVFFC